MKFKELEGLKIINTFFISNYFLYLAYVYKFIRNLFSIHRIQCLITIKPRMIDAICFMYAANN